MNSFEKRLKQRIMQEVGGKLADFTPSLAVEVFHKGHRKAHLELGEKQKYFDIASLTKPVFTVSMMMHLVDEKMIHLKDPVAKYLSWWPHKKMTIAQVLSHTAGLTWWKPYYKKISQKKMSPVQAREYLRQQLIKNKPGSAKKAVYSDLDFFLLGFLIEAVTGKSLLGAWLKLNRKLKLKSLHFSVNNRPPFSRRQYAPTEKCPWRKKTLRGEVHDDNTWSWGGVSSHAGLFGNISDVSKWGLLLRKAYFSKAGSALAGHKTARLFTKRAIPRAKGDWALGLMMSSRNGSTAGKYFSSKSVGHTGFTGTSLWFDPVRDLLVVVFSNRVHPTRNNMNFRALRPRIHDFVVEIID